MFSLCPCTMVVGSPRTHLLLHKELKPQVAQPLAQLGTVDLVVFPGVLQTLQEQKREKVSAAGGCLLAPTPPPSPPVLLVPLCLPAATH